MTIRRVVHMVALAVTVASVLAPGVAMADQGGDPFGGLSSSVAQNIPIWGGLMAMIAALVVAGVAYYGSQNTGRWVGRFLVGTLFIVLATKGPDLLNYLKGFFGI